MMTKYPNLEEFFGVYFHQDWPEDAPTANGIVQKYVDEWPVEGVGGALNELRQMLESSLSEGELEVALQEFGCYYNPEADALTYKAWLLEVQQLLERAGGS